MSCRRMTKPHTIGAKDDFMDMNANSRKCIQLENGEYLSKGGQAWIRRTKRERRKRVDALIRNLGKWKPGTLEYRLAN